MTPVSGPPRRSTKRRALVLLNPNARHGQGCERYASVKWAVDLRFDAKVVQTEQAGNDAPIRAALASGVRTFVAAGGDGTVNAVIDALVRLRGDIPLEDLTLGAVGLGSSNDAHKPNACEIEGIPLRLDVAGAEPRDVGFARWDGGERAFLVSASLGVTAAANGLFNRGDPVLRTLKRWWVDGAITWAAVRMLFGWHNVAATLVVDGESTAIALTNLGVAKTPWLSGGLRYDTPIEPRRFAVNLCEDMGRWRTLRTLGALACGRFAGLPGTRSWSARGASLVLSGPCDLELDGEVVQASRVQFELLPERIRLCR